MKLTIDFESRSACDLKKHGAWVYSEDPTTEVLCMSFKWEGHKAQCLRDILHCGGSEEARALVGNLINDASTIEAHNMAFEYAMWTNVCAKKYGWPPLPVEKLRCSAAKAAMHSLPRHLEGACQALGLRMQKDMEGHRLMLKMCKPRKPRKDEPEINPNDPRGYYWHEAPADFERLYDYCIRDVESEEGLSDALRDLPAQELAVWQLDQKINARGIRADIEGCNAMIAMTKEHETLLLKRLAKLTNGAVRTAKQIEQLKGYLRGLGVDLPDLAAATVKGALKGELNATAREILQIRSSLGRSSASKYQAIIDRASADGRVRGTLLYHGAGTGRWCLTGDAEILTEKGWCRIDQWDDNDPIACWSEDGRVDFCGAQLYSFDCREDLVKVSSRFLEGAFTPDHRVPSWSSRGNFHVSRASDFADRRVTVPTSGVLSPSRKTISDAITRLVAMTQADGFVCTNPRHGRMVRFHFKKPRKIRRAIALLEGAGVRHTVREYSCGTTIKVRMEDAPSEMRRAKEFGPWVLGCDPRVFVDELRHWDGCVDPRNATGGFEYSTKVKSNAEWVVTMAHLAGVSASVKERLRSEEKWAPSWRVHIRNQDRTRVLPSSASAIPFRGRVFCPKTPTGFFLVRYNGKIHITGNSGAGIQPQNFPSRIKISAAPEEMLEAVRAGGLDLFGALYDDDPMSAAGAITRSVLMAEEGKDLVVADYSAIEGRVLAWLAGEETELDAYRKDLDPYIVSASMILHKPYGEITKDERQSPGKISVLACIAEGSLVLTDHGLVPIEEVDTCMRVWDGVEWVAHRGTIFRGIKEVIGYDGLQATPDHVVFTEEGREVRLREAARSKQRLAQTGFGGTPIRLGEDYQPRYADAEGIPAAISAVPRVRGSEVDRHGELAFGQNGRMPEMQPAGSNSEMATGEDVGCTAAMPKPELPRVQALRNAGHRVPFQNRYGSRNMGDRELGAREGQGAGSHRQRGALRTGESEVGYPWAKCLQHPEVKRLLGFLSQIQRALPGSALRRQHLKKPDKPGVFLRRDPGPLQCPELQTERPVWDILNCGPRNRFTVSGKLVHNCGYGGSVGAVRKFGGEGMTDDEIKEQIVKPWREAHPMTVKFWYELEDACMSAVAHPSRVESARSVQFRVSGKFLMMRLPSGRLIYYYDPQILPCETSWGEIKDCVTYMTVHSITKKWVRTNTYSGKLAENATQAVARDLMALAMLRVEEAGYPVVLSVHDELISEVPEGFGSVAEFEQIMCELPPWAMDLPLKAAGWRGRRYRK